MQGQHGLTLIELMIVLAIAMILATLAYPTYAGYITRTHRIEGMVALLDTMQQQERYFMRNNTYAAFSAMPSEGGESQFRAWSASSAQRSSYELEGRACPGQSVGDCIELRATPGTARVDGRFKDPECGVLTLDSAGRRGASGLSATCWP